MTGFGIPQADIAMLLDIDVKTLRKHLRRELDRGSVEATMKVVQTLFQSSRWRPPARTPPPLFSG